MSDNILIFSIFLGLLGLLLPLIHAVVFELIKLFKRG